MLFPPDSVLLDTGWPQASGALLFSRPGRILTAYTLGEIAPLLDELDHVAQAGEFAAGYLAYEAGYALETIAPLKLHDGPLAWFGVYDAPKRLSEEEVEALLEEAGAYRLTEPVFATPRPEYRERIERIRHHIREGDVYQINFTAPFRFGVEGDPVGLYRALRRKQQVGYGALIRAGDTEEGGGRWVLSRSPELFFQREGERVTARPMKGTVRRGPTTDEDLGQAAWLTADEKNRAENLMIVDLLRNDLSVVAEPGSVVVPSLFEAERYDTLWQMTSTVEAQLRPDVGVAEVVRALFPCGSVTGAPKIRAMQLIHELEDEPRGVYCGAIGFVAPDRAVFNVPIRTITLRDEKGTMGVGSGIVWDSDPEAEYDECLLKARFLTEPPAPDFALLETIRWEGGYEHLDRHFDRLRRAAAYFGYPFDEITLREALAKAEADLNEPHRIRLTLDRHRRVAVETISLAQALLVLRRAVVYPEPANSGDPFLRHKTTHRAFYDDALAWAGAQGFDEAILVNERGELTEGTRTNLFVQQGDRLWTPPLASGGLDGVYRAHLLATDPTAGERVLQVADLASADAVYLVNALRGKQAVTVAVEA